MRKSGKMSVQVKGMSRPRGEETEKKKRSSLSLYEKQTASFHVVNRLVNNHIYDFSEPSGHLRSRRLKHMMPIQHFWLRRICFDGASFGAN